MNKLVVCNMCILYQRIYGKVWQTIKFKDKTASANKYVVFCGLRVLFVVDSSYIYSK